MKFGRPQAEATLKGYPAIYMSGWPVVLRLTVQGAADPTLVEAELTLAETGGVVKLSGELFGPSLGILVWRDDQRRPQAATMAEYNRRYWKALAGVEIPAKMRPQQFPIIDRFIGGDDDRRAWQEGIEQLQRAGFSTIMLPPSRSGSRHARESRGTPHCLGRVQPAWLCLRFRSQSHAGGDWPVGPAAGQTLLGSRLCSAGYGGVRHVG